MISLLKFSSAHDQSQSAIFSDRGTRVRVTREFVELWNEAPHAEQTPETGAGGAEQTHQTGAEQPLPIGHEMQSDSDLNDTLS